MTVQRVLTILAFAFSSQSMAQSPTIQTWIRVNQLGYTLKGNKTAVWGTKLENHIDSFLLVNAENEKQNYSFPSGKAFGSYGPFRQTYRLDFSSFGKPGHYYIQTSKTRSAVFAISDTVYDHTADFCLRYMRQQRSGFNPFLKDSCHTHDGFTVYAPVPDGTHIDVSGGWHDATDYLQYSATSANATYHLLAAYRDFPEIFGDDKLANGLEGKNGIADVLDEAKWGLDWLLKMFPKDDWMFNQLADDRDHKGMRIPKEDTNFYGKGLERPVYFCTGEPQGLLKYKNRSTGVASTAGKFSSAFALGANLFNSIDAEYAKKIFEKSEQAFLLGIRKPGVCQTAPGGAPYFYEEDNWTDDMELAAAEVLSAKNKDAKNFQDRSQLMTQANGWADEEPVTPWFGQDTARHYQWYPFINLGHYELAKLLSGEQKEKLIGYYREGIERVWKKASRNAFYRGIPFIWCSNNLTVSFAIQCYWYRQLSHDTRYLPLEQACVDWLFGCNPWGTSMVYGLPSWGDTPEDPHSSFSHLKNYPVDGGMVDGPVYTSIYSHLLGVELHKPDAYAPFQSDLAVYHDDYGDYSTNEPTMDGTASLIYLLASREGEAKREGSKARRIHDHGALVRGDSLVKKVSIVFTGDEFGEGLDTIIDALHRFNAKASFFFTGNFYSNPAFSSAIQKLKSEGHFLGPHSNKHLLYCDWKNRDQLLVTRSLFQKDLKENLLKMKLAGIDLEKATFFLPPYEWWNDSIANWSEKMGMKLICFTPGIRTNADYTYPAMKEYLSSSSIWQSILVADQQKQDGLNGFIILIHAGADPRRKDKFYNKLGSLIQYLYEHHYMISGLEDLLNE
ncbi:MAG: cellulase [Bacteroidetes bacterium]|nr:MAG: cellulase [Bacteroidota bacterium]